MCKKSFTQQVVMPMMWIYLDPSGYLWDIIKLKKYEWINMYKYSSKKWRTM